MNTDTMNEPTVGVGIPNYENYNNFKLVMDYLLQCRYMNLKIMVSDDNSKDDNIEKLLCKCSLADSRIKYYIQPKNIGLENNFCFTYSMVGNYDYFIWMANDDLFETDYIQKCVDFLENNPDYMHCAGHTIMLNGDGTSFKEVNMSCSSNYSILRLYSYLSKVYKNGVLYGVTRGGKFIYPMKNHVGSDWVYMAQISMLGKIKVLDTTSMIKSNEGISSSRKKLTDRWQATGVKKVFFETYTAYQMASHIFDEDCVKKKYNVLFRFIITVSIFLFLNAKFLFNSINRRIKL